MIATPRTELDVADTVGILRQSWVRPQRTSAGLGWPGLYVSTQSETPYEATFEAAYGHWARLREIDEDGALLVRPDGYIAWRAQHGPASDSAARADLTAALGRVLGTARDGSGRSPEELVSPAGLR